MKSNLSYTADELKCIGLNAEKKQIFSRIAQSLIDYNIYVPLDEQKKYSTQSGWNQRENFIGKAEAKTHLSDGGNVGINLGKWFDGTTYVLFDVEKSKTLPENIKAVIDSHTVVGFGSIHGGHNRLVPIENREAYELLDSYDTTITSITDGDSEDLELITNGASPLPPSEVHHSHCSEEKPCDGNGVDRYKTVSINPEAPPMGLEAVRRIGKLLSLEGSTEEEPEYTQTIDENVPSPTPKFNIEKEFEKNVPSVKHSFSDRLEYMKYGEWERQEEFIKLWNGNFEDIPGSQKQRIAELKIGNDIGFYFGNNEKFVRLLMDNVNFESKYEKYESHRETVLRYATSQDWCYCDSVTLETKLVIASQIFIDDKITKTKLQERTGMSHNTVEIVIDILKSENVIEKCYENRQIMITNTGITEGYIQRLDNIANYSKKDENNIDTETVDREVI